MIAGRRDQFAIEAEIDEIVDGWVFGKFRFWLCGQAVGDWDDSAHLNGCANWLRDFVSNPRERFEASLERASPEVVFQLAYDRAMALAGELGPCPVDDAYGRFHIAHLGMSSFDRFDILLLYDADGGERCLWRRAGSASVQECRLGPNEMERVASEFLELFERELVQER